VRTIRSILSLFLVSLCVQAQTSAVLRHLDIVVSNESGTVVRNLTEESFTLLENGGVRGIERFSGPDTPWNIVLLIDQGLPWLQNSVQRSGGFAMASTASAWQPLLRNLEKFVTHLRPNDRLAMATFSDQVHVLMDWRTTQPGKVQQVEIKTTAPGPAGLKDFYGSLKWAITKLEGSSGRKIVIVLTDGRDGRLAPQWFQNEDHQEIFDPFFGVIDSGEAEEFRRTSEDVRSSGVRFYFMAVDTTLPPEFAGRRVSELFPGAKDATANYIARVRVRLERFAQMSDGGVVYARPDQAISLYGQLYDQLMLASRYTIEYVPGQVENSTPEFQVKLKESGLRAVYSRNP
jgi:hypothetical protein